MILRARREAELGEDRADQIPITTARQLAARLPDCRAHFGPGGHVIACDHAGEILDTLTSALGGTARKTGPAAPADRGQPT